MRAVAAALATLVASLAAGAQTRSDRNGDPLPPGAIARLGSAKFVHGERIRGLSLAPDGSVALAADERQIILWDVATGRELRVFKDINAVRCAALSPDGKLVAANGVGPRIWIWDAKTGRELHELVGKIGGSETLAWSSDGKWIAASADKRVNMWDAATGELLKSFAHEIRVVRIAFAPDCKRLVTGGFAENCHTVWDIAGGKELGKLQGGPGWGFSGTAGFAPDGKSVTGYCEEKIGDVTHCSLRSWDVGTGEELRDIDRGPCSFAGFTPGGKSFVSTKNDTVRVWDTESGEVLREWLTGAYVGRSCLSLDGKLLVAEVAGRIRFWNPATGKELRPPDGHIAGVKAVSFAPDGKSVASGSADGTVRIWDWKSGKETARHGKKIPCDVDELHYRPDAAIVYLESAAGRVGVWNPTDDRTEKPLEVGDHNKSLAFHPDWKTLLTSAWNNRIGVWDSETKKEVRRIGPLAEGGDDTARIRLDNISLSADGKTVAWVDSEDHAGVVDFVTGKRIATFAASDSDRASIEKVLFSPDGTAVATTGHFGYLQIFDSITGGRVADWDKAPGQVLAYSPDGRFIALGDREIVIWDVSARREVIRFAGHRSKVNAVAFEPRGRVLVSASQDGTLLVWDLTGVLAGAQLPEKALAEPELAAAWEDMKSADPAQAQRAVVALACGGPDAVAFLGKRLAPIPVADPKRIGALVTELGDRDYRIREIAARALAALGEVAGPALLRALDSGSAEVRSRAEELRIPLSKLDTSAESARSIRAVAALEYAGDAGARRLLQRYAAGDPGSRLTRRAKGALERIARQELAK